MVTLKKLYTVTPAKPTPNGLMYLSECDQIKPWTHVPIIYVYKSTNPPISSSILDILKISLSQALFHFYPLAGRLHWTEGGRLQLHCNAMGAHLLEAESEERVADLGDFCPTDRLHMLVPNVDYTCPIEKLPLFLAQLTRFRCGGVSIGIAISHILADGFSTMTFMNSWAKLARGECLDLEPFHDRSLLRPRKPFTPPRFDHEEFKNWPLLIGCSDNKVERKKETSVAMLRVTRHQIEKLKQIANENMGQQRPYSSFEVLAGHLWRCACLVRPSENTQKSRLRILVESRNRLNPPLPKGYFGNVAFPSSTPTCVFGDLRSLPLSYAAGKIREANEKVTDEYIMSALDFITSQQDSSGFRTSFQTKGLAMEGTFLGNPNISANSWVRLPVYGADFGWGKPVHVGPSSMVSDGKLIILPTSDRDGSFAVVICLQTAHMDAFKKCFYQNLFSKL